MIHTYEDIIVTDLYHHGIKGQKWGVRRFQRKDGSLTSAGKKRYSNEPPNKSKSQQKYEEVYSKYKAIGYSDDDARKRAKGYVSTAKTLKIIGGVAVAAAVAYGAYRYYDTSKDRFISPDKALQTVHTGDIADRIKPGNPFYASYTKKDNTIYASKVFTHFTDESKITRMYTKDGIKVASEKTGRKIFNDLVQNNPEVKEYAKSVGALGDKKKGYLRFNYSLVLRNDSPDHRRLMFGKELDHDKVHNIFYDELKKRGYGAVIDVNDSKREGFTWNPVIVFDNQIKHVISTTKATKEDLGAEKLAKGAAYASLRRTTLKPHNNIALVATGIAFMEKAGFHNQEKKELNNRVEFVKQYKKEHPNTKLTDSEINDLY